MGQSIADLPLLSFNEIPDLGDKVATYDPHLQAIQRNARFLWFAFVFFALIEVALLSIPFLPPPQGVQPLPLLAALLLSLFPTFFIIACWWRLRQLQRGRQTRAIVFKNGLAFIQDTTLRALRWDEIAAVEGISTFYQSNSAAFARRIIITITCRNNQVMRIDGAKEPLVGIDRLYRHICLETSRILIGQLYPAVQSGETIRFGFLGISKLGLHWGRKIIAWNDTANLDLKGGLRVRNPNTWPFHPWIDLNQLPLPNHLVFIMIAKHLACDNGSNSQPTWPI